MFGTKLKVAAGVLATAMVSGGLAFAAIPGPDGTIAACYTKYPGLLQPQGSLRVVDAASQCRSNETALTWNQRGLPGLPGEDGVDGVDGLPGLPGADGVDGQDGVDGTNGVDGLNGVDGVDGVDGQPGTPGPPGQNGTDGQDGLPGPVGPVGPAGPAGISAAKVAWSPRPVLIYEELVEVMTMTLPAGSHVIQANLTWEIRGSETADWHPWVHCELREGTHLIGFGGDRRARLAGHGPVAVTIPIHGGAIISGATGTVSVWCKGPSYPETYVHTQMVAMQIGGFL